MGTKQYFMSSPRDQPREEKHATTSEVTPLTECLKGIIIELEDSKKSHQISRVNLPNAKQHRGSFSLLFAVQNFGVKKLLWKEFKLTKYF